MAANEKGLNSVTLPDLTPTEDQCVKAYSIFIKEKALGQQDCKKEDRKEQFEIIHKMAKCKEVFAYCHNCHVIYNKSKYSQNHLDSNAGSLTSYFIYDEKQTQVDKDQILVQMFKDQRCYCVIMDMLFLYPISNHNKCGDNIKLQRKREEDFFECLLNEREAMLSKRISEMQFSKEFRKNIRPVGLSTKEFIGVHKNTQLSRIEDIEKLWSGVTKLMINMMYLSVGERDLIYIEHALSEIGENLQTVKSTNKIQTDINKYELSINLAKNKEEVDHLNREKN